MTFCVCSCLAVASSLEMESTLAWSCAWRNGGFGKRLLKLLFRGGALRRQRLSGSVQLIVIGAQSCERDLLLLARIREIRGKCLQLFPQGIPLFVHLLVSVLVSGFRDGGFRLKRFVRGQRGGQFFGHRLLAGVQGIPLLLQAPRSSGNAASLVFASSFVSALDFRREVRFGQ